VAKLLHSLRFGGSDAKLSLEIAAGTEQDIGNFTFTTSDDRPFVQCSFPRLA
jgi:hypothetical protein